MIPVRVMPEDVAAYGEEEAFDLEKAPRKIAVPKEYIEGTPVTIAAHHLDTNHHVNNAQYVDIAVSYTHLDVYKRQFLYRLF